MQTVIFANCHLESNLWLVLLSRNGGLLGKLGLMGRLAPYCYSRLRACRSYALEITRSLEGAGLRALYLAERGGLATGEPIDPPHIPCTVYAYGSNGFARERVMPRNLNVMGYPFPPNTRAPTIQEHKELVWLAGNLKLEVTNYSRELYNPGGVALPSGGGDDDGGGGGGGGGEEEDSEATPSYKSRKRQNR
ncbi:hypothetical protein SO802_033607 [Lithocarpus litseifolius]|uniref:Uncharacterized protein n=1 Tax=Lithocarpus litseifolius TaxID=425828 RepID=A0AAW2BGA1_9ROSI